MSAGILDNRNTIDLTGIDTDEDDDEVVFIGASHPARARTPLRPAPVLQQRFNPPGGWHQQAREHEEPILVESDDDELEEQVVDRLIPPQQHPRNPPVHPHDALRIFSPPAQFIPEPPRDPAFLNRRPTPHPYGGPNLAPPPAAPHHPPQLPPRIGLGGGFLAFRGARPNNSHNRDNERRLEIPHWIRNVFDVGPGNFLYPPPPRPPVQVDIPVFGGMVWDAGRNEAVGGPVDFQPWHIAGDDRLDPPKPTYSTVMTHHADKPRPGFTFDFEPSATAENAPIIIDMDESQASSSSASAAVATPSLICARCNTTLRMGSKTMWGLRCGHVVCGECGEYLSKPVEGKGKGKAEDEGAAVPPPSDVKGKGKARASKGRGKTARAAPSTRALRSSTLQATAESTTNPRKRKQGKKHDPKPVLLGEYEYACPVEGCFRPHFSEQWKQPKKVSKERDDGIVEMEIVWKPKPDLGAIPIFT
ncbi:hypothetical protein FRC04_010170 [Tulasnella sp. 424]|nr:hypothetical protein FRC04_010170 [Tulasnella sp. 424]KAG8972576.1 hypothetical protein FRC05_009809 [Tulasnella sp. 425]